MDQEMEKFKAMAISAGVLITDNEQIQRRDHEMILNGSFEHANTSALDNGLRKAYGDGFSVNAFRNGLINVKIDTRSRPRGKFLSHLSGEHIAVFIAIILVMALIAWKREVDLNNLFEPV